MLSHVGDNDQARPVDIGGKAVTRRAAHARSIVELPAELAALAEGGALATKKGPVFETARLAGIMGAKRASELIPLCHPLAIEDCQIEIALQGNQVIIDCRVSIHHKTGVEMEALTGASVAALTVYDMCKAVDKQMRIGDIVLLEKTKE